MSLFLLDTDTLSLLQRGHAVVLARVNAQPAGAIVVATVTIQEQMHGWQGALSRARNRQQLAYAYQMLVDRLLPTWCRFGVLSFTEAAVLRFEHLRSQRLNVGMMDLRIAAVALENGRTVVTRNQRDFDRVPGLATVDWSV
jgi:tRNA(fMet)-specific endonuclease VapC